MLLSNIIVHIPCSPMLTPCQPEASFFSIAVFVNNLFPLVPFPHLGLFPKMWFDEAPHREGFCTLGWIVFSFKWFKWITTVFNIFTYFITNLSCVLFQFEYCVGLGNTICCYIIKSQVWYIPYLSLESEIFLFRECIHLKCTPVTLLKIHHLEFILVRHSHACWPQLLSYGGHHPACEMIQLNK